jgi:phenylalanine-4-hydroxylase
METPRRIEHRETERGYVPVYTTAVVDQPWARYAPVDHEVWATLFRRQQAVLPGRACGTFLEALAGFGMCPDRIPKFSDLNKVLRRKTGWELVGVEGLLPDHVFFDHLSKRCFPVTWWIRRREKLDYIAEPDLFHDLFGHVPLLLNPVFADYMQAYGDEGVRATAIGPEALMNVTRLYWYTVEFGLIRTGEGLRIYGAGIVSSKDESIYCLESPSPNRLAFDLERVMRTQYRIDACQKTYFVIDGFDALFQAIKPDLTSVYARLAGRPAHAAGAILPTDREVPGGSTTRANVLTCASCWSKTARVWRPF